MSPDLLVVGRANEANVDGDRVSRSYSIIEQLLVLGAEAACSDPCFPRTRRVRRHGFELESVPCSPVGFAGNDSLLLLSGPHAFRDAARHAGVDLVMETRDGVSSLPGRSGPRRLVKA